MVGGMRTRHPVMISRTVIPDSKLTFNQWAKYIHYQCQSNYNSKMNSMT